MVREEPLFMEDRLKLPLGEVLPIIQNGIMNRTSYFGVKTFKCPTDAWVYQEIIFETRPEVIIEIGNKNGGSTLMLAHLCDLVGKGRVIGLDLSHETVPAIVRDHPRITLIEGDACAMVGKVEKLVDGAVSVLVIEDSSHTYENTLNVLRTYEKFVKEGGYFIVEDSICHHGLDEGPAPGPYEAIDSFLQSNPDFISERQHEHFLITWNPKGYLRRVTSEQRGGKTALLAPPGEPAWLRLLKLLLPPILVLLAARLGLRPGKHP